MAPAMAGLLREVESLAGRDGLADAVLREFFPESVLADQVAQHVAGFDHVGALAPVGAGIEDAVAALEASPFRSALRRFRSRILALDLSRRVGRTVRVDAVEARSTRPGTSGAGFEWFVADLSADVLGAMLREEYGCHVALRLVPGRRPETVREIVERADGVGVPRPVTPVLANGEIGVRLFYLDRADPGGRVRRLEIVASD